MNKIIYILLIAILFVACDKKDPTTRTETEDTPQTTLMYMTGTSLSYYFNRNITAASAAIADKALGNGRFLVFKHSGTSSASLTEYKYEKGACTATVIKEYTDITSLSYEAINEVIADTKEAAPADVYNLIISGHATGWVPKEMQGSWTKSNTTSTDKNASTEVIDWEAMSTSPIITRYLGSSTDSFFNISELKESLEATSTHFGYILFDECFMSSIEALYDLRGLCDYIVASPCEIMGDGFPYETVIPKLFSNDGAYADLQGACEEFVSYYTTYSLPSACVALTVTSELDALAEITYQINNSGNTNEVNLDEIQGYERLTNHVFIDFEQYMLAKCSNKELANTFTEQMAKAFPVECRLHTDRFFANIGVSASSSNSYEAYYTTIEYYSGITTSVTNSTLAADWALTSWAEATN